MGRRIVAYLRLVAVNGKRIADPPIRVHPAMTPEARAARKARMEARKRRT